MDPFLDPVGFLSSLVSSLLAKCGFFFFLLLIGEGSADGVDSGGMEGGWEGGENVPDGPIRVTVPRYVSSTTTTTDVFEGSHVDRAPATGK